MRVACNRRLDAIFKLRRFFIGLKLPCFFITMCSAIFGIGVLPIFAT
jgi:hypothetical protein